MKNCNLIFAVGMLLGGMMPLVASHPKYNVQISSVDPLSPQALLKAAQEALKNSPASVAPTPKQVPVPAPVSVQNPSSIDSPNPILEKNSSWFDTLKSLLPYAAGTYILHNNFSPAVSRIGHSARLTQQDNITALNITITICKNGWHNPLTFEINAGDVAAYQQFSNFFNGNLTPEQKRTALAAEVAAGNVPFLAQNETYSISIEGTVTYQNFGEYRLKKESMVETIQFGGDAPQPADKQAWIQLFWQKKVAARIASVWNVLPLHLVPPTGQTVYRTTISSEQERSFQLSNRLATIETTSLPELKEKVIDALADYVIPGWPQHLLIQFSIHTPADQFFSPPIRIVLNTPHDPAFTIRVPAYPLHTILPATPVPFIHNACEQRRRAEALWQQNFQPVWGAAINPPAVESWKIKALRCTATLGIVAAATKIVDMIRFS